MIPETIRPSPNIVVRRIPSPTRRYIGIKERKGTRYIRLETEAVFLESFRALLHIRNANPISKRPM